MTRPLVAVAGPPLGGLWSAAGRPPLGGLSARRGGMIINVLRLVNVACERGLKLTACVRRVGNQRTKQSFRRWCARTGQICYQSMISFRPLTRNEQQDAASRDIVTSDWQIQTRMRLQTGPDAKCNYEWVELCSFRHRSTFCFFTGFQVSWNEAAVTSGCSSVRTRERRYLAHGKFEQMFGLGIVFSLQTYAGHCSAYKQVCRTRFCGCLSINMEQATSRRTRIAVARRRAATKDVRFRSRMSVRNCLFL